MAKIPAAVKAELIWIAVQQLRIRLAAWLAKRRKPTAPKEPTP